MVQVENLGRIIDEHPFFQGIDAKLRELLIGCAANEVFEDGQFILREGGKAEKFYLIRAGSVAVEVDVPGKKAIVVETLSEGEVLGWSWTVEPFRNTFDARAQGLVRVLSFDGKCLRAKMAKDAALGYEVLKRFVPVMAHRLQVARLQMLDLYGPGVAARAAKAVEVKRANPKAKGENRRADAKIIAEKAKPARAAAKADKKAKPAKKADKKPAKKAPAKKAKVG